MPDTPMPRTIIGEVVLTPAEALPGETVLVEVRAPDGTVYANAETPRVMINGVTGSQQYLQFARPGKRTISVVAQRDEVVERVTTSVTIKALDEPAGMAGADRVLLMRRRFVGLPLLHVASFHGETHQVAFSVGGQSLFYRGLTRRRPILKRSWGAAFVRSPRGARALTPLALARTPALAATGAMPVLRGRAAAVGLSLRQMPVMGGKTKFIPTEAGLMRASSGQVIGHARIFDPVAARVALAQPDSVPIDKPVYRWDFGDGTRATTYGTRVEHDYRRSLDPNREHQQFHVTLRIQNPDGTSDEVRRTLTIHNAYAICKNLGVIAPFTDQQVFAQVEGFAFTGRLRVENVEPHALTLTHRRVRIISQDPNELDPLGPVEAVNPTLVVPAKGQLEIPVAMPFSRVPRTSSGFTVHFFGQTPDGKAIRVEATFDVRAKDQISTGVTFGGIAVGRLPGLGGMLRAVVGDDSPPIVTRPGALAGSNLGTTAAFDAGIGRSVAPTGRIARSALSVDLSRPALNTAVLGSNSSRLTRVFDMVNGDRPMVLLRANTPPPPVDGSECDPDNLPELSQAQLDEGWTCQATPEIREVETPARFLNALKGDTILSPGGSGLIGGLLRQVSPSQRYSHSGIMTRNYDQITHSTSCEDRLLDYPNGSVFGQPAPTEGFVPNALKYQWPGAITQSVEDAIFGEPMADPDSGKQYRISGFTPVPDGAEINGHWEIVPPLVVKPDPLLETPEIRTKLRQVANDAVAQTGNSHYRLFCYTDPSLGQRPQGIAPPTAGWAAGTYPSVCSSFIWMTLKRQGVILESVNATVSAADLEIPDVLGGAQVDTATADGLYLYTAMERRAAGEWLKDALVSRIERKLEEDSGILSGTIDFFSDMTNDVANQMINTFASDWATTDSKDSDAWRNTGDANAVSPDNILFWDSPSVLGLYGYAVPLSYRTRRLEEVVIHRWRKIPTKGRLSGRVWFDGAPVAGALVQVYDGKTDYTDAAGFYEIPAIPFGPYVAKAFKDNINGFPANSSVSFDMSQAQQTLDITLSPPKDYYRRVQISATVATKDDEWGDDEHATTHHFREVFVGPWHSHEEVYFEQRMGGEIRIELRFVIDINMDRSLTVSLNAKMFEGTSEDTGDKDDEENAPVMNVPKDQMRAGSIHLYNDEFDGGDTSDISFTVFNLVQP